jgi:hypothetical protein
LTFHRHSQNFDLWTYFEMIMTNNSTSPPATWKSADVVAWATQARLTPDVIASLTSNEVDGPTLVTLTKSELQSELGIISLPARRFLWELIKSLKSEQATCDYSAAIEVHQQEILSFSAELDSGTDKRGPDAASGGGSPPDMSSMSVVVDELVTDVQTQRQVIEDHMLAFRVQKMLNHGQNICKDAELAHEEQERLNRLLGQVESDREYAESLASGRERAVVNRRRQSNMQQRNEPDLPSQAKSRVSSLFGLSVQSCSENEINVQEAFLAGKVKPMIKPTVTSDEESSGDDENEDRKPAAGPRKISKLPFIDQCNVCYEENLKGYHLACSHLQCVQCMRKLFRVALRDNTLLPLVCCEVPIDMNIAIDLLDPDDAILIIKRVEEKEAKNKMYCPSCSSFMNLDLVDSTQCSGFNCDCGTLVCTTCKTKSHPGYTCRQNQAIRSGSDELIMELSREQGWKQCPKCSVLIELRSGCNHMTCTSCSHGFCYRCLQEWDQKGSQCVSGTCELWDEDRLIEAGEARVQQEEAARGRRLAEPVRRERLREAMAGLRANEVCVHTWVHSSGYKGDCPNCGFTMWAYGMRCRSDCGSTVCYTCAHHRIPNRGWR